MTPLLTRRRPTRPAAAVPTPSPGGRPVLLATLDVPFEDAAAEVGVDAAVEAGQPLLVVNIVESAFLPSTLANWDYVQRPDVEESLRRPAELAHSLGVRVERLRVRSPHPVAALLQLIAEREPALVVFGPDRSRVRARRYRRAAEALRSDAACLIWLPG